ncbi:hypothetical protein B296_00039383 [Ensete ventricosum]|uniref:Uncharacterized protein n=1 Tax=Ensete ventricosum TaxID=4639 RepID=A0A426ZTF3_ENSVE|nr:hypothetical protein B296_00039383 [Ensete ventricosum]
MAAGGESTANFGELSKYFIGEMEGVRRFATADRVEADSEPLPHSDRLFVADSSLSFSIPFFLDYLIRSPRAALTPTSPVLEMAEVKPEEIVTHPPMDQLQGFEYCIDSNPSWGANSSVDWFDCVAEVSPNHESDTRSFNCVFLHSDCSRLQPVVGYLLQVHLLLFDHKMYLCLLSHELTISFCFRFFSPLGMVPVVSLVGFGLFDRGFPVVLLLLLLFFLDIISKICYMKR